MRILTKSLRKHYRFWAWRNVNLVVHDVKRDFADVNFYYPHIYDANDVRKYGQSDLEQLVNCIKRVR